MVNRLKDVGSCSTKVKTLVFTKKTSIRVIESSRLWLKISLKGFRASHLNLSPKLGSWYFNGLKSSSMRSVMENVYFRNHVNVVTTYLYKVFGSLL